jgi:acyl-CoA synthetase (AMP-forming)/AMP-acid ligase II
LYAGLQVVAQSIASGGCLVIPGPDLPVEDTLKLIRSAKVTHASATPSYWRWLLLFSEPGWWQELPLRQVTIGGEAVDQVLLDRLRSVIPQARIAHIYATTELGRCFSVTDAQQGFPVDYLRPDMFPDVKLKIENGELYVQSRNGGLLDQDRPTADSAADVAEGAWRATGDLVEVVGNRVLFRGRRGDVINVGGNKVHPLRVEEVIRDVPGVRDVLVLGKASSIAGHLVACQIALVNPQDADSVRQAVLESCQQRLQRHEIPRIIEFVSEIELTSAGKRTRSIRSAGH